MRTGGGAAAGAESGAATVTVSTAGATDPFVGAGAIGTAAFVALAARQDYSDAIEDCPGLVCRTKARYDATQDARSRANLMTYVGAGGIVLVGVGLYLMVTSGGKTESSAVSITPVVSPDSVGVSIGGAL